MSENRSGDGRGRRRMAWPLVLTLGLTALATSVLLLRWRVMGVDKSSHVRAVEVARKHELATTPAAPQAGLRSNPAQQVGDHQTLARSLDGTDVDGYLAADQDGNLILVLGVRDFFDYFLSTVGEIPLEQAVAFMEAYARERLPEKAVEQLMALLADYMAYREAAANLYRQPLVPIAEQNQAYYLETLDRTFRELRELRRTHMSDEAVRAFFALEEEYGKYTLDRMAIQMDAQLSPEEKSELLGELRAGLESEILRHSEERAVAQAERAHELQAIMESDMDGEERRAALSQYHAPDDVERIVQHLEHKRDFRARMDEYLAARAPLMTLPENEREPLLSTLRQRYFHSEQELIWARTYEARE